MLRDKYLDLFIYNPETGDLLLRKSTRQRNAGWVATHKNSRGYLVVNIDGKECRAHRIIWLMQTGMEPHEVDHINHIRTDNRWENLRDVGPRAQQLNMSLFTKNKIGTPGIRIRNNRFCAYIMVFKKQIILGTFDTLEEARAARKEAEIKYGFHENHGQPANIKGS